ncbi:hypothetical protein MLD52_10865 [Puniceicoccaceae bacterium K14]|nr:hypothetical protein [Puniceicoccaceae bacterium K14]
MPFNPCILLISVLLMLQLAHADSVTLKDVNGRIINVEIIGASRTMVAIQQEDGSKFDIELDRLATESKLLVELWAKQKEIEIRLTNKTLPLLSTVDFSPANASNAGDSQSPPIYVPTIKIQNPDPKHSLQEAKGYLTIIGISNGSKKLLRVLNKQKFSISLPSKQTTIYGGDSFTIPRNATNRDLGFTLFGYILTIQNSDGKTIHAYASSPLWIDPIDKYMNLIELADYDRSLSDLQ